MTEQGEQVARMERAFEAPLKASAVWPAVFLVAVAGGCWAVTTERMEGMVAGVWAVMMAGMMLPSLSPMAVAYSRSAGGGPGSVGGTVLFATGYLLVCVVAGLLAYVLIEGVRSLGLGLLGWDEGRPVRRRRRDPSGRRYMS
jgi:predicted metal-binding membrane protein